MRQRLLLILLLREATAFVSVSSPLQKHSNGGSLVSTSSNNENPSTTRLNSVPVIRAAVGAAGAFAALSSIQIVSQGNVAIVERLGKFHQCLNPGLHFIVPLVDRLRTTLSRREQVFDIPPQSCISKDNAPLAADAVVYWKVLDPNKAYYAVMNLELAIQNLVLTQLRSEIGKMTLDETFSAREQINSVLLRDLDVATEPWGIAITRVEVRDIVPNREILGAMEQQMAAERTKRALVIQSEGELQKAVNEAEGEAQSRLIQAKASAEAVRLQAEAEKDKLELEAQGAAQAIDALASAVGGNPEEATKFQLLREYIDAQRALATSENAKVILSPDAFSNAVVQALSIHDITKNS